MEHGLQELSGPREMDPAGWEERVADLLIDLLALCRLHEVDPECALRHRLDRMEWAFRRLEQSFGDALSSAPAEEVDPQWKRALEDG